MFSRTPLVAKLLRLVSDTAALRPSATDRHFQSHPFQPHPLIFANASSATSRAMA